jgi:SPOR domain
MRAIFLLLVAANLALFAWAKYYAAADSASDPDPLRRQIKPESVRILAGPELAGLPLPKPKPVTEAAQSALAEATQRTLAEAPAARTACVEWGGFAIAEAARAEKALEPLALGARLSQRRSDETAGWWVFIPPQANRPAALKKTAELKALGIDDYFIIQEEGKMRWAVSLGVFSSEDAAKSRLDALRAKGVRSAQTGERETQVAKVWLQTRGANAPQQAKLRETAQAFPGTEVRDCP